MDFSERYSRQILFPSIGKEGQKKLGESKAVIIGCGGLGSNIANNLARAGIGTLRIIDRDIVQDSNLQRQVLFDENDVKMKMPKALAAKSKLYAINSSVKVEAVLDVVKKENIDSYITGFDLVMDGTDNFGARFMINEACVKKNIPWIFGSVAASNGMICNIFPGSGYCFKCLFNDIPPDLNGATSENAGILNSAVSAVSSIQTTEALKLLTGNPGSLTRGLIVLDIWDLSLEIIKIRKNTAFKCPVCG